MRRREFLQAAAAVFAASAESRAAETQTDPWSANQLLEPAALAEMLRAQKAPVILFVGFPVLYRQKHIANAILAGPASKPEGLNQLKQAVAKMPKTAPIVIYCGCCPMVRCPNLRPAFSALRDLGFTQLRVLNLPTNFHTDWAAKGYPVQSSLRSAQTQ